MIVMGAGSSRTGSVSNSPSSKYVSSGGMGRDVTIEDGNEESNGKFRAGKSWNKLVEEANKSNNYKNNAMLFYLKHGAFEQDKKGRYCVDAFGNKHYFDEHNLYIANQVSKAYDLQRAAVGNSKKFLMTYDLSDGTQKFGKVRIKDKELYSQVYIHSNPNMSLQRLANKPMGDKSLKGAIAYNQGGTIVVFPVVKEKKGFADLRSPKSADRVFKEDYDSGWCAAKGLTGSILHEYGHGVESVIQKRFPKQYSKFLQETNGGRNQYVSGYAHSYKGKRNSAVLCREENFAEAYAAYVSGTMRKEVELEFRGKTVSQSCDDYYASFEKLMKSCGIKKGRKR